MIPNPSLHTLPSTSSELLHGSVDRVTYHNNENGYSVLRIKAKGHRDHVTLVGNLSSITAGEFIEAEGQWIQHRDFGLQFKAQKIKTIHPSTLEGIEKYLGSGLIKGIGPHFAKKMVEAFKFEVFEVIDQTPQKLLQVDGIGAMRLKKITSAWKDQKVIREIMVFLQSHGVSTAKSVRIYKTYGESAIQKVKSNPYQLARDIYGIGFKSADQIAMNLGIPKNSMIRARAGVNHVLFEQVSDGHCAFPETELLQEAIKLLEIEETTLKGAIELEVLEKNLIRELIDDVQCLYSFGLFKQETEVAHLLHVINLQKTPWNPIEVDKALPWAEKKIGISLSPLQKQAVSEAIQSKLLIITGGPGTGKTTLTRAILTILQAKGVKIALASPTGRAAKRLSECTGLEAKTIHRLLGFDPKKNGFQFDQNNPLPIELLLLDEVSMVDISLLYSLLRAAPSNAAIVFVGDVDQLPSVGPGEILKAMIDSGKVKTVELTQIFRQAAQSQIIQNAHKINQGLMPDLEIKNKDADFHFIEADEPELGLSKILELVKTRIPKAFGLHSIRDIQVLSPMHRGTLGGRNLNLELQKILNPNPPVSVERFGFIFSPGDKVMVTENDYDKEVFNGDIGFVESIDPVEQELLAKIDDRLVAFDFNDLDILMPAYAISIHKSQGSEYPAVVIPLTTQHYLMLKRNLVYTGVTRGKKLVVLVGQRKALAIAIKSKNQGKRWNKLAERIQRAFGAVPPDSLS